MLLLVVVVVVVIVVVVLVVVLVVINQPPTLKFTLNIRHSGLPMPFIIGRILAPLL